MIQSTLDYLGAFEPLFLFLDSYLYLFVAVLFVVLSYLSKNYLGLVIASESTLNNFLFYLANDIVLIEISMQFVVMGFVVYLAKKNPLILIAYLVLMFLFVIQYFANLEYEVEKSLVNKNNAWLAYYLFYLLICPVLYLMYRGLYSQGDNGRGLRFYNSIHRIINYDNYMLNDNNSRFKRLFKKRYKEFKKT